MDWGKVNPPVYDSDSDESWSDKDERLFNLLNLMAEAKEPACLTDSEETTDGQSRQSPTEAPRRNSRGRRLSELTEQVAVSGELLISESGQAFAYQKDRGFFKPIPKLDAYLAGYFGEGITNGFLSKDLQEVERRLSWPPAIRCSTDSWNANSQLVNLENGVFNMETGELLPHDAAYRFTYQVHANYIEEADRISCPAFEAFCKSSLEGDSAKRKLLLEFIGYICTDSNDGK